MIKVLFDTNVVLDLILERRPFYEDAVKLFGLVDQKVIEAYVSATTITDLYYISAREVSKDQARKFLIDLLKVVDVAEVGRAEVIKALESDIRDFEDAVQVFSASASNADLIITRNADDFKNATLPANDPRTFIESFNK